tara:strand:+ start:1480 stop:2202 length:723 start_codon:yes stop_codon:yes gene_type:complete
MSDLYIRLPYFLKYLLFKLGFAKKSFKKIQNLNFKVDNKDLNKIILFTNLFQIAPKDGVIVECGVARGFTLFLLYKIFKRKIYAFDSFEGFPDEFSEHDSKNISEIIKIHKWHYKIMSVDLVKQNLIKNNISAEEIDQNIIFKKGFFPHSFKDFNEEISFLHLDVDLYKSYKDCLDFFFFKLKKGGIVSFDEYHDENHTYKKEKGYDWKGSKVAIDEFVKKNNLELLDHRDTGFKYIIKN